MKVDEVKKPKSYRHDYDMTSKVTSNQSSKSSMMYKKSSVSTRQQEKMVAASINLDDSDIKVK